MTLVEQVMTSEPYASAKRVFWVVDNGSSHRGQAAIDPLARRFLNAVMVHTAVHASWLNQIEVCFSVVQRKVVSPDDFTDLAEVEQRLAGFEKRYNATARPFRWTFTRDDLHDLLTRISQHDNSMPPPTSLRRRDQNQKDFRNRPLSRWNPQVFPGLSSVAVPRIRSRWRHGNCPPSMAMIARRFARSQPRRRPIPVWS